MRARWIVLVGISFVGASVAGGCGGDSSSVVGGDAGATSTPPPGSADDGGSATATDGGNGDASEPVTDGGANVDTDAGAEDGGLPDGGACNAVVDDAPAITSTCISALPTFDGGALVAGKYWLTAVAALGAPAFCQGQFVPTGFKETVEMTVTNGVATLNAALELGGPPVRHRTSTLTPGAGSTSPATGQTTCPTVSPSAPVRYASHLAPGGKQVILALLPYGKGGAVYRFEKQ